MSTIEVEIDEPAWLIAVPDAMALVQQAALVALAEQASGGVAAQLSGDGAVRRLNAQFRGKDAATNVLAFAAHPSAKPHLGDIILAYGVCIREAEAQGKPIGDHLQHLTIHGVLHLLGYDHESDTDAATMEALERELLAALGVADPYALDEAHAGL